ncbi:sigma factor [Brevibacillus laterosporus]|nr:sigma factor [Brevibacillus laterosporus]
MLGSLTDAEDIVQDTFIKLQGSDIPQINNVKSYLSKMVTNRCINEIKSVRKKKRSLPWYLVTRTYCTWTASRPFRKNDPR